MLYIAEIQKLGELIHLSMVYTYALPGIPGADAGEKEGGFPLESSLKGGYLVGIT